MWSFTLLGMDDTISLKKNYQFSRVYRKGNAACGKYLILYCLRNRDRDLRLGITTSRKVGKSVVRNRIRRLIRENYRSIESKLIKGFDVVFVVRSSDRLPSYYEIKKEMRYLFKKLGMFKQE